MEEPTEQEDFVMPKMKRCDMCTHSPVCGAYAKMQNISDSFDETYPYTEFPAKSIALAVMCKEYKEKDQDETLKEYKPSGCCSR